jgi:hypothetical protein
LPCPGHQELLVGNDPLTLREIIIKPLKSLIKTSARKEQEGEKDNFHNPIFSIDKTVVPGIFRSKTLIKLPLSKGGDGWGQDLRSATVVAG